MNVFDETTRSWSRKRRGTWWVRYVASVAATVAALQGMYHGIEWYAKRVAGLQTAEQARRDHDAMRQDVDEKIEKLGDRIEKAVDRLGARIDRLSTRGRR